MTCKKFVWVEKTEVRRCLEILLAIIILSMTIFYVPERASADNQTETVPSVMEEQMSETAYRIKPLQDRLGTMEPTTIEGYVNGYSDMDKHWSRTVVGKLSGLDIIAGYDGKFWPGSPVQVDQFVKMAVMAMGYKIEQGTEYWAQPYIDTALGEGLVGEGEFADYKKPLTREQMARIAVRVTLKVDEKPDDRYDQYIIGKISDYSKISDDLKQYVIDGYNLGLMQGSAGRYNPKETLTRAEAAAVIIRFLDATERKPMRPGEDEVIKLVDNLGNPMEIYPGAIKEYFEIEKVMQDKIPLANGYFGRNQLAYNPDGGEVFVCMYESEEKWQQNSTINKVADFTALNVYKDPDNSYAYTLSVWNKQLYKELFADYMHEVLRALYGKDADKAIALHDKYMNLASGKPDGSSYYETPRLNDRQTDISGDGSGFSMYIKLYCE